MGSEGARLEALLFRGEGRHLKSLSCAIRGRWEDLEDRSLRKRRYGFLLFGSLAAD